MKDVFQELRRAAADLHGVPMDEVVIEITGSVRVLRRAGDRVEVLEQRAEISPRSDEDAVTCVASELARRAQNDVHAKTNDVTKAERALSAARLALERAESRKARLIEIAGRLDRPPTTGPEH